MQTILKIEELMMFILGIYLYGLLPFPWWLFPLLLLSPDIGMLGYLINTSTGAVLYNIFHHKGLAILVYLAGIYLSLPLCQLLGILLFSHASFDRIFGYGLKYRKGFTFTHLGNLNSGNG